MDVCLLRVNSGWMDGRRGRDYGVEIGWMKRVLTGPKKRLQVETSLHKNNGPSLLVNDLRNKYTDFFSSLFPAREE